jgi:hypothetical protein
VAAEHLMADGSGPDAIRNELADLRAGLAAAVARIAALEAAVQPRPPEITEAELVAFARVVAVVGVDQDFEAGDVSDDPHRLGMLLAKLAKLPEVADTGLRVERLRGRHRRARWVLRLAGVDLGGPGSASQAEGDGA